MLTPLTAFITLATLTAANTAALIYLSRKVHPMSDAAFQKLTADALALKTENDALKTAAEAAATASAAKDAQILELQGQLSAAQAAAGTSDADVLALDAQLVGEPPAPVAPPAPETPPAT